MAKFTRKELKKDPFLSVYYDDFVEFAEKHYQKMIVVAIIIAVVVAASFSWKHYKQKQELSANAMLGEALGTYSAYVGDAGQGALSPGAQSFPDSAAKYQTALKEFTAVYAKYPSQQAGQLALYHVGLCQAQLGQHEKAVETLRRAAQSSDEDAASLARFSLAGELAQGGETAQAQKIYRDLAGRPTLAVPAATSWLALAGLVRQSQPAEARQIYNRLMKQYSDDAYLVETVKQQLAAMSE